MFAPNDILIRETPNGPTVWVSQRVVEEACGVNGEYLRRKCRYEYLKSLSASWQSVVNQDEFYLGLKPGKSWRWGRRYGQFYYDVDTIPNRAPVFYRDRLPSKEELIAQVDAARLRGSRERRAEQQRELADQVQLLIDNVDLQFYLDHKVGDKRVFDTLKAQQLAEAAAWCRFIKRAIATGEYREYGLATQGDFYAACVDQLAITPLEGFRIKTLASLRKKIAQAPDDPAALRRYLISGRYGNDHPRKIGKYKLVDYATGEVSQFDEHEAIIMTYWLNPGGSTKDTKRSLWQQYAGKHGQSDHLKTIQRDH